MEDEHHTYFWRYFILPDIVPNTPFADGSVADADTFAKELYEPLNPPGNMEVINGRLDEVNLAAGQNIDYRDVRAGTFTTATSVGATATLDYFYDFFNLAQISTNPMGAGPVANITSPSLVPLHVAIPGAAQSFYLYYSSIVFLSWDVELETAHTAASADVDALDESISLRLFVDGQVSAGLVNRTSIRRQVQTRGGGNGRRHYAGHFVLTPAYFPSFTSEGWHKAEIRIAHQQYQIRVTTRRFNVIALKA